MATQIGQVIDGKYEILKQIGKGGMSVVYLAMDKHLNKQWAVKEIQKKSNGKKDEVIVNSLLAEANLMKKLDHPALPRIVDIIDNGSTIYVIMDYIEGESLDKILLEYGAQPENIVLDWAKQLCDALSYLHSQKPPIIYRDMKPANIMLKPEGNLKVIDFGIAREYKELSLSDTTVLGTRGYAPPEQYQGHTDIRSDIYALGMTMHHLVTGIDPRPADYVYAPIRQWNPDLSDGLEAIIDKCVQAAPENRYQNCAELMYDLEHPELVTKDFKQRQKHRLIAFITAASLSVAALICGVACQIEAKNINNNNYDTLIGTVDSLDSYKEAIDIYPSDTRAYMSMLDTYENLGEFNKSQNDEFLAVYNAHKDSFDNSSASVAELNYKIGMMYFNYYGINDSEISFSSRVQKAYPFFAANYENTNISADFTNKTLSDCYYQICSFYKKYILSAANVEEASRDDYTQLLSTMKQAISEVNGAGGYDQLTLYNSIFMFLYDQRTNMASLNVPQTDVDSLFETVTSGAKNIVVQKDISKKVQSEIADYHDNYKEAIDRAYSNLEERK
jgi:serine/threonine protein kinase